MTKTWNNACIRGSGVKTSKCVTIFWTIFSFFEVFMAGRGAVTSMPIRPSCKPKMVIIPLVVVVVSDSSHSENNHTRLNEGERFTGMSRRGTENVRVFVD